MKIASTSRHDRIASTTPKVNGPCTSLPKRNHCLHQIVLCLLAVFGLLSTVHAGAETWINPAIVSAISKGLHTYTIPAGTYNLDSSIVIPAGTRNFTLQGAGSTQTLLTATNTMINNAIAVGNQPLVYNTWGFGPSQCQNVAISNVKQGDTWITLQGSLTVTIGAYYVIYDNNYVQMSQSPYQQQNNRRELVRILAYNASTNSVQIDYPAARDYDQSPTIAYTDSFTCQNITVKGFGFDGTLSGTSTNASNGVVGAGLTDRLYLTDLETQNFGTRSVSCVMCRNITANGLTTINGISPGSPGNAYGPTFCFCRFVVVNNSTSTSCRHGFVTENGSTDVTYNYDTVNTGGDMDSHGFDERRLYYNNCTSAAGVGIGNANWLGGAQYVTITNCTFGQLWMGANVDYVTANGSAFSTISFNSASGTTGVPNSGYPDKIQINSCTFASAEDMLYGTAQVGTATFKSCTWTEQDAAWGNVLRVTSWGSFIFENNTFVGSSTRVGDTPILLLTSTPGLNFVLSNCLIQSAGSQYGVGLTSSLSGAQVTLAYTTFNTPAKSPALVQNSSSINPKVYGSVIN